MSACGRSEIGHHASNQEVIDNDTPPSPLLLSIQEPLWEATWNTAPESLSWRLWTFYQNLSMRVCYTCKHLMCHGWEELRPLVNRNVCFPWFYHIISWAEWLQPWGDFKWVKKRNTLWTMPDAICISCCCRVLNEIRPQVWKTLISLVSSRFPVMRKEYLCTL